MPKVLSRNFGEIEYVAGEQFVFPSGLPGFPSERVFVPVEVPEQLPLLYLQSAQTPDLCFVTLPVSCIIAGYLLSPNSNDLDLVGLNSYSRPGAEMLCLAILCFETDGTAAANLRAPIIINVETRMGVQAIQSRDDYPVRYRLGPDSEVTLCS